MWEKTRKTPKTVAISKFSPLYLVESGGPDGELGASMRYLSQRYTMPYREVIGILTDVGTSGKRMFHFEKQADKPYNSGLFMFTLRSNERLLKYQQDKEKTVINEEGAERIIKVYVSIPEF